MKSRFLTWDEVVEFQSTVISRLVTLQLTDYFWALIAISPKDGQIAYAYDEQENSKRRVAVIPFAGDRLQSV